MCFYMLLTFSFTPNLSEGTFKFFCRIYSLKYLYKKASFVLRLHLLEFQIVTARGLKALNEII